MKVVVDSDLCQGHGECVALAPEVFALPRGADQAQVLVQRVPADGEAAVRSAIKYCPAMALSLAADDDNQEGA